MSGPQKGGISRSIHGDPYLHGARGVKYGQRSKMENTVEGKENARQKWHLDQAKAKASCQDKAKLERRRRLRSDKGQVDRCPCCWSGLAVGQREALRAQGTGQMARTGQPEGKIRSPGMGWVVGTPTACSTGSMVPSPSPHVGLWLLENSVSF